MGLGMGPIGLMMGVIGDTSWITKSTDHPGLLRHGRARIPQHAQESLKSPRLLARGSLGSALVIMYVYLCIYIYVFLYVRGPKDHINISILQTTISGIPLILGLETEYAIFMFMWSFGPLYICKYIYIHTQPFKSQVTHGPNKRNPTRTAEFPQPKLKRPFAHRKKAPRSCM